MTQIRAVLTPAGEPPRSTPPDRLLARYPVLLSEEPAGTVSVEYADDKWVPATNEDTVSLNDRCIAELLARAGTHLAGDTNGDDPVNEPTWTAGKRSAGIVLVDDRGSITIREPANHYDGYEWSYPKGRLDDKGTGKETPREAARRELTEETGFTGRIIGTIGDFKGNAGITRFYVGVRTGGQETLSAETWAVKTVSPLSALELLNVTRDKNVLVSLVELAAATVDWHWTIGPTPVSCRLDDGHIVCEPVGDTGPG